MIPIHIVIHSARKVNHMKSYRIDHIELDIKRDEKSKANSNWKFTFYLNIPFHFCYRKFEKLEKEMAR